MSLKALYPKKKDDRKKYDIIGFDVETINKTNDFYLGGLYLEDDTFVHFTDKHEMIKFILSRRFHNKLIYATNLGFDFNALFFGTEYWNKFKIIQVNSKIIACIYEVDKLKVTLLDTMNYVPMSVRQLGDILKLPKLETPKCLGKLPKNKEEFEELLIYNKRDCEVSKKFMDFLQKGYYDEIGGELKITIASISMNLFQRKYLRFPIRHECNYLNESEESFKEFIFSGYYGGRTEVFTRGKIESNDDNKYNVYDINSLYPSVMVQEYPNPSSIKKVANPNVFFFKYMGMSEVTIFCPKMKYPYLPYRDEKLLFPTGTFRGVYTHFELEKAIELGYKVLKVHKQYIYTKGFYPFKKYVEDIYSKRLELKKKGDPLELLYKLNLNTLYGKFAMKHKSEMEFIDLDNEEEEKRKEIIFGDSEKKLFLNENGIGFQVQELKADNSFIIPIFSAYTTAYARDKIYHYISKYNALYCDTDSILTSTPIPETYDLGGMKVEYDVLSGILVKPKMYMYETPNKCVVRLKGVPTRTKQVFNNILIGRPITYDKFTKIRESLRRGFAPNEIISVTKLVGLEDSKRVWGSYFNPYVLEESQAINLELDETDPLRIDVSEPLNVVYQNPV